MSPPQEDEESASGLHAYAMREDVAAMSAFLQAGEGLDIDARDEYVSKVNWCLLCCEKQVQGYTALHLAADRGNVATIELLLKHGADKTLKVSVSRSSESPQL
jgi:ankyrin repeat protein